ncbi:MAG: PilZ domain-containing protein, partial [Anaerolineae bacterium]|nr:PilZ domain-containing protein [Anaerolineae bacterium]
MFYLFNSQSKEQFGPFSKTEIANQIGAFTPDLHVFLFVWSAGWPNWKSLQDFQQGQKIQSVGGRFAENDDTDLVREDSALIRHIPSSEINKRKFTRFSYRMKCTIKSSGTIFETHSVDISLGGIQLENALPSQM